MSNDADIGMLEASRETRHAVFLALASFAGKPALLLTEAAAVEYANPEACMMFECADQAALTLMWQQVVAHFGLRRLVPSHTKPQVFQAAFPLATGLRPFTLEAQALGRELGSGYFATLNNPGQLDRMENELLLASERRGWSHLRESLLHDLKGILNSMQISLELISEPEAGTERPLQDKRLRRIAALKDGLIRMDRALRLLPGGQDGNDPADVDFDSGELVKEIFAGLRQLVRRNSVELKVDLPGRPLPIRGRRGWIKQALLNVAVHRLNAMRAGGSLAVEVLASGEAVVFTLRDNVPGTGASMVEESYRLSWSGQLPASTDLRVARALIEAQGGNMDVVSGPAGTTIVLQLPR